MSKRSFELSDETSGIPVICERIRHFRLLRGMEQKALAAALGITANSVSNWEQGRSRPDLNLLPGLCRALDVSLYDLFSLPEPYRLSSSELQHLGIYRKLKAGNQKLVDGPTLTVRHTSPAYGRNGG